MIRITHPRPQQGRQRALGVEFVDGFAEVTELHPEREQALVQHGFTVDGGDIVDLNVLSKRELLDIAEVEGIDVPKRATRAELIDIISRAAAEPIPGMVDNGDGTFTITPFFDLTEEQLRETAKIEGIDIADDATKADIVQAFTLAQMESD